MAKVKKTQNLRRKLDSGKQPNPERKPNSGEAIKSREETKSGRKQIQGGNQIWGGNQVQGRKQIKEKINSEKKDETVDNMPDDGPENENMSGLSEKENELEKKGNADNEEPDYKEDYDDIENDLPPVEVDCYKYPEKFDRCF